MAHFVPKEELSALVSATLATPEFSGKDMTLKKLRKEVERRLGKALPKEQKPELSPRRRPPPTRWDKLYY